VPKASSGSLAELNVAAMRKAPIEPPADIDRSAQMIASEDRATVSLTVKLPQDLYRELLGAGMPTPTRAKRRTNQDMVVEAIRNWLRN
jgi:hypothetical protein